MPLRIIAGTRKGHPIKSLKGQKMRPTLDRVREAVFNVIGAGIKDARFLDLFAGTGAIGLEALSREARICIFNDAHKGAAKLISENLAKCKLKERGRVYNMTALRLLDFLRDAAEPPFDIVYIDPPYEEGLYDPVFRDISDVPGIVAAGSLVIVESNSRLVLPEAMNRLCLRKKSSYGDTIIWYYQYI